MLILNLLLRKLRKPTFEINEYKVLVEDCKYRIRIITVTGEIEDIERFFKRSKKLSFSRFYIIGEELFKPYFAPSLQEAVNWFIGKDMPHDRYSHAFWGAKTKVQCPFCDGIIQIPFDIKKVESLIIYRKIPNYREIVGWRVSEVGSDLMGKGFPNRIFTIQGGRSVITWESPKNLICKRCSG